MSSRSFEAGAESLSKELSAAKVPGWVRTATTLGTSEESLGLIMLGEKSLNLTYTHEDLEFLTTLADQATLALENFQMEERIIDTKQMDTFNRFASFVVHDLKNTVGMLSLTAENAKENLNDVEFQQDAIDTIRRSIDKMQSLIHSLSAFKSVQVSRTKTDLVPLLKGCLGSLKAIADARDIDLRFSGDDKVLADVDPQAIERVVENLVTNALDSTEAGGQVDVETRNRGRGPVQIVVADNGDGFDEDYLQNHVFRPFHSTKNEGLGIGLVMCKTLIDAHEGSIAIDSSPGKGSRITVHLPSA